MNNRMLVNSLDSMISLYDMYDILNKSPVRYFGHKCSKEFYGISFQLTI